MSKHDSTFKIQPSKIVVHGGDNPSCGKQYRHIYRLSDSEVHIIIGDCTSFYLSSISYFWVVYHCLPLFVPDAHYIMCSQCPFSLSLVFDTGH